MTLKMRRRLCFAAASVAAISRYDLVALPRVCLLLPSGGAASDASEHERVRARGGSCRSGRHSPTLGDLLGGGGGVEPLFRFRCFSFPLSALTF